MTNIRAMTKIKIKKARILLAATALIVSVACWLIYRQSMLSILGLERYILVYADGGYILTPDGRTTVEITYLDAGATHSGNFRTILSTSDWMGGRKVVAEGYSSYPVRYGRQAFPIEWVDEKTFWVTFVDYRTDVAKKVIVHLK